MKDGKNILFIGLFILGIMVLLPKKETMENDKISGFITYSSDVNIPVIVLEEQLS